MRNHIQKGVSYMANLVDRAVVDFIKTFEEPGLFLGVEPKMRADKDNPNSPQEQARDKTNPNDLKWVASVAVKIKNFQRERKEILSITLTSPTQPCANVPVGQMVVIDNLEMGIMKQDKGGFSQFWSATAIRPVEHNRPPATVRPTADDIRQPVPGRVTTGQ